MAAKTLQRGIGDVAGWLDWIKNVISDLKGGADFETGDLMEQFAPQFAEMAADVAEAIKDGLDIGDIVIMGDLVTDIMKIAKKIENAPGEQKHQFVIDAVWLIYHSVDTGPDGNQNRIKVPGAHWLTKFGITEPEEKLERFTLKVATEFAMRAAYKYMKEKDEV
jgi:hypothetical protein